LELLTAAGAALLLVGGLTLAMRRRDCRADPRRADPLDP
jgi:LPXTG-motif cell wall-anchored protein